MHLYLSTRHHLNSLYSNEEGQALYKVETPPGVASRTSSISINRVIARDISQNQGVDSYYAHFAHVEHKTIGSSVLRVGGMEYATKDYFRKDGWGKLGRHRVFTGPDGGEYKWLLETSSCKLVTNDNASIPVATFHQKAHAIIGEAHPASLEIFPAGELMIREILITFVYIEKIRGDKARGSPMIFDLCS